MRGNWKEAGQLAAVQAAKQSQLFSQFESKFAVAQLKCSAHKSHTHSVVPNNKRLSAFGSFVARWFCHIILLLQRFIQRARSNSNPKKYTKWLKLFNAQDPASKKYVNAVFHIVGIKISRQIFLLDNFI